MPTVAAAMVLSSKGYMGPGPFMANRGQPPRGRSATQETKGLSQGNFKGLSEFSCQHRKGVQLEMRIIDKSLRYAALYYLVDYLTLIMLNWLHIYVTVNDDS